MPQKMAAPGLTIPTGLPITAKNGYCVAALGSAPHLNCVQPTDLNTSTLTVHNTKVLGWLWTNKLTNNKARLTHTHPMGSGHL